LCERGAENRESRCENLRADNDSLSFLLLMQSPVKYSPSSSHEQTIWCLIVNESDRQQITPKLGRSDEREPEVITDGGEDGIGGIAMAPDYPVREWSSNADM
jgi:hypothetical protein